MLRKERIYFVTIFLLHIFLISIFLEYNNYVLILKFEKKISNIFFHFTGHQRDY